MANATFSVQGNRISCSDGRWWELQENPAKAPLVGSVNDGAGRRRAVKAIAGGVRDFAPRRVVFYMTADLVLAWEMAAAL